MADTQAKEKSKDRNVKGIVLGIFMPITALFGVLMLISMLGIISLPLDWVSYMVFMLLAGMGPYGFYASGQISKIRQIEKTLPDFLRDVAEAGRFGMTLANAIVVSSSGRYGRLTPEIRKMAAQIEWGVPVSDALKLFQARVDTPMIHRVVAIVIKSSDAGGSVADVLSMVAHDVKEGQLMEAERRMIMSTYIMVIYIAFIVFLVTIIIMASTFLPQMTKAGESLSELDTGGSMEGAGGGGGAVSISVDVINTVLFIFLMSAIIHAIGDGLICGVLESGMVVGGLRHSFLMTMIAYVMLYSMLDI
jgi:flagellar protein FlaJ